MSLESAPPPLSRRQRRMREGSLSAPTALNWVDADRLSTRVTAGSAQAPLEQSTGAQSTGAQNAGSAPFFASLPRRTRRFPAALVPAGILTALAVAYAGSTLLWPLDALPPAAKAVRLEITAAPVANLVWPEEGIAGVRVAGFPNAVSAVTADSMASITKVVTSMMVLEKMPLEPGEQGPEFFFTEEDSDAYWRYLIDDQSALDVPVDGVLTQYQLLQGILMGSANNYVDMLSQQLWGSDDQFAAAARIWLDEHQLRGLNVVNPSGLDAENTGTPAALLDLAELAMEDPIIAEIVGTKSVILPGAGEVINTNALLEDPSVLGIKTGALTEDFSLLAARDIELAGTVVRVFAVVQTQPNNDARFDQTRALFQQVEDELLAQDPLVDAGVLVGTLSTRWGAQADLITAAEVRMPLWNGGTAHADANLAGSGGGKANDPAGSISLTSPAGQEQVAAVLAQDLADPTAWWRLTHPLVLWGLTQ